VRRIAATKQIMVTILIDVVEGGVELGENRISSNKAGELDVNCWMK
jgi:hypothetical protein